MLWIGIGIGLLIALFSYWAVVTLRDTWSVRSGDRAERRTTDGMIP